MEQGTAALDELRKTLWKRWKRSGALEGKQKYKQVDKRVKTGVKVAKQRNFARFARELDTMLVHEAVSRMGRMIKARKQRRLEQTQASKRIEPVEFTNFVATQHSRRPGERRLQCRRFRLDDRWRADVEWALRTAPRGTAVGSDEVFVEALQAGEEKVIVDWVWETWASCGRHAILPKAWRQSYLCPLLKKEPASRPENWRAVALLSHCRKLIEKILDRRVRESYSFHKSECGFRQQRSVETAILRPVDMYACWT